MTDTTTELTPVKQAVERGAAWLDNMGIKDWRKGINLERLDMRDPESCILGQVFEAEARVYAENKSMPCSGFHYGVHCTEAPMPDDETIIMLGFEVCCAEVFTDDEWSYEELREAWIEYLKEDAS